MSQTGWSNVFLVVQIMAAVCSPLPQKELTISQFRADAGRSFDDPTGGVVISASYSKVRRQGRKGDSDPFLQNNIYSQHEDTKVKDHSGKGMATPVKSQMQDYYSETATTTMKAPRRIIIFLKHENPSFDTSVFKIDLERELAGDVSIFLNQDQDVIKEIINGYSESVIVNLSTRDRKEITGNIFSEGIPLEDLEGEQFAEALKILNTTRYLLEQSIDSKEYLADNDIDSGKKIIVMINSAFPLPIEVINLLKTRLEETFLVPNVIYNNELQDVLKEEYKTVRVPILVSISLDNDNRKLSGNLYYGSEALENIEDQEKRNEAFEIFGVVKMILETNFLKQISTVANTEAKDEVNSFDFYEYESSAGKQEQSEAPRDEATEIVDDYFIADDLNLPESESYVYYQDEGESFDSKLDVATDSPVSYEDVDFGLIQEVTKM